MWGERVNASSEVSESARAARDKEALPKCKGETSIRVVERRKDGTYSSTVSVCARARGRGFVRGFNRVLSRV